MRSLLLLAAFLVPALAALLGLKEGARCKEGPPPWTCRTVSDCPGIQGDIKRGEYPALCSFKGPKNPVVCCQPSYVKYSPSDTYADWVTWPAWADYTKQPVSDSPKESGGGSGWTTSQSEDRFTRTPTSSTHSKAGTMCKKYSKHVWKKMPSTIGFLSKDERRSFCGMVAQTLIVDGVDAEPREFPHMARIGYEGKNRIDWMCGGSLISERYVLSAGHCTEPEPKRLASWVNLGDLDVSTNQEDAQPVTIRIIERTNHPDYKSESKYHDLALFKLETEAPLGIYIRPACLNTHKVTEGTKALASGWGHTSWGEGARGSSRLQKVGLKTVSNAQCNQSYESNIGLGLELPIGIDTSCMICAGGSGAKDTCQGDSGGPLQVPLETPYCMYSVIGVTSFGKRCGLGVPGVYTNVANYISWIEGIVWPE